MKNKLSDLNNYLFSELESLDTPDMDSDELKMRIAKANTVTKVAEKIIENMNVQLDAAKLMAEYVPGHHHSEIVEEALRRFPGIDFNTRKSIQYAKNHNLKTGFTGHFSKGHTSFNKGKKMSPEIYERAKATMFKKGNVPANLKPVGSERVSVDGYVEIKSEKTGKWMLKNRYLYEKYHNIKLKRNELVLFADGDRLNFDKENLICVTQSANLIINSKNLRSHPETAKTGILIGKVISKQLEKRKGGK